MRRNRRKVKANFQNMTVTHANFLRAYYKNMLHSAQSANSACSFLFFYKERSLLLSKHPFGC